MSDLDLTVAARGHVEPELLLGRLNRSLLTLRGALATDRNLPKDEDDRLLEILRRTLLAEMSAGLSLVGVAGSQGAGKTTLVQEIYELDSNTLGGNLGRGERLPVVVRERGKVSRPVKWLQRVASIEPHGPPNSGVLTETEVSDSEWADAVEGRDRSALLAGIDVPARFFGTDDTGFLLLPGYEHRDRENRIWQDRMRSALVTSPACIVVSDQGRLASSDQEEILADLRETYLDSVSPIVAISRTEGISDEDQRQALIHKAAEKFGEHVQRENIILTGTGADYRDKWIERLREQVLRVGGVSSNLRRHQLSRLERPLTRDLSRVLRNAEKRQRLSEKLEEAEGYRDFLDAFDAASKDARQKYEKAISSNLNRQLEEANKLRKDALSKWGGWEGVGGKALSWIMVKSDERNQQWQTRVVRCWTDAGPEFEDRARLLQTAENDFISGKLPVTATSDQKEQGVEQDVPQELAAGTTSDLPGHESALVTRKSWELPQQTVADFKFISGRWPSTRPSRVHFLTSVKLLPAIGLEALRLRDQVSERLPLHAGDVQSKLSQEETETLTQGLSKNHKTLMAGAVALLGVDAIDGQIDSVPALAGGIQTLLFGKSTATAATAVSVAAAAALAAAAGSAAVIHHANTQARTDREFSEAILVGLRNQSQELLLEEFDEVMLKLRNRLDATLRGHLNVDEESARLLHRKHAIAQCESARASLLDSIGSSVPQF